MATTWEEFKKMPSQTAVDNGLDEESGLDGSSGDGPELGGEPELTEVECCLVDYTEAVTRLEAFQAEYTILINQLGLLHEDVACAESFLKGACREHGAVANERFSVTVQPKSRRWYDSDRILELAPWVRDVPGVLVVSVDKSKVEALAKGGMIPADVAEQALRVEQLTPAVTIKRL